MWSSLRLARPSKRLVGEDDVVASAVIRLSAYYEESDDGNSHHPVKPCGKGETVEPVSLSVWLVQSGR
jgi:hypothetical protein